MSAKWIIGDMCAPKSKFNTEDIPDLSGKVVIVTGGNTGIGFVTCKYLLIHNATVYMLCRSASKAQEAIQRLKTATGGKEAKFIQCDLADLPAIKRCVEEFTTKENRLDILFNSAGLMFPPMDMLTAQGYDAQFGTCVIGHAYLTKLLLPTLLATAKTNPDGKVRVITTSSSGHALFSPKEGINYSWITDSPARRKAGTSTMYGMAKWGNVVFAKELARRYGDQGIISHSLHPGPIKTDLQRHGGAVSNYLSQFMLAEADPNGAITQLYAGTSPETGKTNGQFFIPWARLGAAKENTDSPEAGKKLWEFLEAEFKKY